MNNKEMVDFIKAYEGDTELKRAIKKDVSQRIEDYMGFKNSLIEDDYITKQIKYFNLYMEITSIQD